METDVAGKAAAGGFCDWRAWRVGCYELECFVIEVYIKQSDGSGIKNLPRQSQRRQRSNQACSYQNLNSFI